MMAGFICFDLLRNVLKQKFKLPFAILLLVALSLSSNGNTKNVLVLHSYNSGLSWTDNINKGIFESFQYENHRTIDLRCEFMDTKHFENEEYFENYKKFIEAKYLNTPVDLIICSDNAAFNFMSAYHNEIFKGVPVVFCGINYCDSIPNGFTGIMEDVDFETNLQAITQIHPDYHKLYIINDRSITGTYIGKELSNVIESKFPALRYEYLTNYTLDELQIKLSTLQENDLVLLLLFNFDRLGNSYSYDVILDDLNPYCKVPIYGVWDFYLGKGIVGGQITNAYQHGLMVSKMAKEILAGKPTAEIPVISGPVEFMFDYKMLKKYNISTSSLPPGSELVNLPFDFIRQNLTFFVLLSIIFILLIILILVLLVQIKRARRNLFKEKELASIIEAKSLELEVALKKAENSNRLKESFISNISHEVRTPLNGILGFSELLSLENKKESQQKYIDIIRTSGKQLLGIIDDILNISLIDTKQVTINRDTVSINKTINELVLSYTNTSKSTNKIIKGSTPLSNGEDIIYTDKLKFGQIFTNLIENANKFTNKGIIEIGYGFNDGDIQFYVKDNGIGIDPDNHELIFERFRQVQENKAKAFGGNGLGLSISKAFTELLGGKIWVKSELGLGATFYFTLPFEKAFRTQTSTHSLQSDLLSLRNKVLMVVEDDYTSYIFLKELLEKYVAEIVYAHNGKEAVDFIEARSDINMILMDLNMPEMNGYDASTIIHSVRKDIPIIAQSAFTSTKEKRDALNAGCVDFIPKPIDHSELLKKIQQYLP